VRVGIPISKKRAVALPCEASWEIEYSSCVVRGPFVARGTKWEEEYP
jgi:hypothetical protein